MFIIHVHMYLLLCLTVRHSTIVTTRDVPSLHYKNKNFDMNEDEVIKDVMYTKQGHYSQIKFSIFNVFFAPLLSFCV